MPLGAQITTRSPGLTPWSARSLASPSTSARSSRLSTVLVTVSPEASRQMRPPRALWPRGFAIGHALGRPFQHELQRRVLRDALDLLTGPPRPGEIVARDYPEYGAISGE